MINLLLNRNPNYFGSPNYESNGLSRNIRLDNTKKGHPNSLEGNQGTIKNYELYNILELDKQNLECLPANSIKSNFKRKL